MTQPGDRDGFRADSQRNVAAANHRNDRCGIGGAGVKNAVMCGKCIGFDRYSRPRYRRAIAGHYRRAGRAKNLDGRDRGGDRRGQVVHKLQVRASHIDAVSQPCLNCSGMCRSVAGRAIAGKPGDGQHQSNGTAAVRPNAFLRHTSRQHDRREHIAQQGCCGSFPGVR